LANHPTADLAILWEQVRTSFRWDWQIPHLPPLGLVFVRFGLPNPSHWNFSSASLVVKKKEIQSTLEWTELKKILARLPSKSIFFIL